MATVNIDYSGLEDLVDDIIDTLSDKEAVFRPIAVELIGIMHKRIHTDGVASDGSQIGTYNSGYLKLRAARGLGKDNKVIAVFTRKLSNSWQAIATENGYAVGFIDDAAGGGDFATSAEKIHFIEHRFNKKIFDTTQDEDKYIAERTIEIVDEKLSPYAVAE